MRLTLINQFYPPDLAPTGHMAASLAEHRARAGDLVTVIASRSSYTGGKAPAHPSAAPGNLRVIRLWGPGLGKNTAFRRVLDYAIFYLQAFVRVALLPPQDALISLTTPPFIALAGVVHKLIHPSARLILWSMDCYPEVLERADALRQGSIPSRLMRRLNHVIFSLLDDLVCLDPAMANLLSSQYVKGANMPAVHVIPNWEPVSQFPIEMKPEPWNWQGLDQLAESFVVLYLGNAGRGHDFRTAIEAAEALQSERVSFLFVGGGAKWAKLKSAKRQMGLTNLVLHPYVAKRETPAVMAAADAALITLKDDYAGVISPSKLHSNLAMGLPILYIGPADSNVDIAIRKFACGFSFRHGEVGGVLDALRQLSSDKQLRARLAANARRAFESEYSDEASLPKFDQVLDQG